MMDKKFLKFIELFTMKMSKKEPLVLTWIRED